MFSSFGEGAETPIVDNSPVFAPDLELGAQNESYFKLLDEKQDIFKEQEKFTCLLLKHFWQAVEVEQIFEKKHKLSSLIIL